MYRRVATEALVLSRRDSGEADRLVTFFSEQYGLLRILAKGVRKISSRRGGHLEPFTRVRIVFSGRDDRLFLVASDVVDYFKELRTHTEALVHAQIASLVVVNLFSEHDAQPRLFNALFHLWRLLPTLSYSQRCSLEVAIFLLSLRSAGMAPSLAACCRCGVKQVEQAIVIDAREGGWYCLLCSEALPHPSMTVTPRLLAVVRFLHRSPRAVLRVGLLDDEARQLVGAVRLYGAAAIGGSLERYLVHLGAFEGARVAGRVLG